MKVLVNPFDYPLQSEYAFVFEGQRYYFEFENECTFSAVNHKFSYGYPDKWEIAIYYPDRSYVLPDQVMGYLTEKEVYNFLDFTAKLDLAAWAWGDDKDE